MSHYKCMSFELLEIVFFFFDFCLFCRNTPAYWMWDKWKSYWDCWIKSGKNSLHQNRYWQTMELGGNKWALMSSFCFCGAGIRGKCYLVSLDIFSLFYRLIKGNSYGSKTTTNLVQSAGVLKLFSRAFRRRCQCFISPLGIGIMFSRAWPLVMFSRAWHLVMASRA